MYIKTISMPAETSLGSFLQTLWYLGSSQMLLTTTTKLTSFTS